MVRLLIAEPERRVRSAIRQFLETCPDIEVVGEACSPEECPELAKTLRPDVVLMDYEPPDWAAHDVTRKLPTVRVVALSTNGTLESRALADGADAFVVKGRPGTELLDAIRRLPGIAEDESTRRES